jgi:Growth inhibitor
MEIKVKRYDIVQADLSGTVGSEQGGVRPVLIIQNDIGNLHSTTTIVMPFSTKISKSSNQPTHTLIKKSADTGLKMDSMLLGEQMRVISNKRIIRKIGSVTDEKERKEIRRVYEANFGE